MFNYSGCVCDVCKQTFTAESDVVVCPECGTPHHRECYKELGHCVNEAKHSEGFEWNAPQKTFAPTANVCPKCQTENPKDASFCENCGISLAPQAKANGPKIPVPPVFPNPAGQNKTSAVPPVTPKALEGEFDGVSYKDMAIYIGESAPYYIYHFKNLDLKIKHFRPFSWSAFLFDGFYFLYRKMWLQALIVILITSVLSMPALLVTAVEMGAVEAAVLDSIGNIDLLMTIGSILSVAYKIFLGYWAIPQYRKTVANNIRRIGQKTASVNEYYQMLVAKSGPVKAVLYIAVFMTALYIFM